VDRGVNGLEGELRLELGAASAFRLAAFFAAPGRGITGIFGPSGAGKTTLLRAIAGLEAGARGHLSFDGATWQDDRRGIFLPPHRRPVGYVFQEASLFPHLTVRGNLEFGWRRVPSAERTVDFERAVALLGLAALLDRDTQGLSGGERQRVAVARALLASPRLLLMDEPLAALDEPAKEGILRDLARLPAELALPAIYVSHSLDEMCRVADHLLMLDGGAVVAAGPLAELLTRLDLPLARRPDAEALIEARVRSHDEAFGLTQLTFPGGELAVPREELAPGAAVRVRILARDVSVTLEHQAGTSILNILAARVAELVPLGEAQLMVRLEVGGSPLLARITRKSAALLGIEPGRAVWAQIKSAALLR
jgi:molybdate transport system ATP-binding protein